MHDKQHWTESVWQQLDCDTRPDLATALKEWWQDPRSLQGLRLTDSGLAAFMLAKQVCHEFEVSQDQLIVGWHLVTLNRTIQHPYFIQMGRRQKLILFGGAEATMYALYGDLNRFTGALSR